jgi:serine/threonine protein phosphatase PrpC
VGDADLKPQGVCATAETAEMALGPGDSFLLVASDGLWEALTATGAVAVVQDTVKHPAMCAQARKVRRSKERVAVLYELPGAQRRAASGA